MEIGRDMWPEWDLKLMTPEQLGAVRAGETTGDANKDDVSRANDWRSSVAYQAAYNRMTDAEGALERGLRAAYRRVRATEADGHARGDDAGSTSST